MRYICGGSKAILCKLLTVETLLCGGAARGGRRVALPNFLRDVNNILNPTAITIMPSPTAVVSPSESECGTAILCWADSDCGPDCYCPQNLRYRYCRKRTPKPTTCTVSCGGFCGDGYRPCGENCDCQLDGDGRGRCISNNCEENFPLWNICWSDEECGPGCSCESVLSDNAGSCRRDLEPCASCGGTCLWAGAGVSWNQANCGNGCNCVKDHDYTNSWGGKCVPHL